MMSKPVENAENTLVADLPFEEALKKLESIVELMEGDDLPLEQMLARYEEGARMAQACQSKLAEAEIKIQQLEKKNNGQFALKPVSLSTGALE